MKTWAIRTLLLACCSVSVRLDAQTNDHLYRSWRWAASQGAPRAAGLGGAFVGLADDVSAAWLNPAGMVTLPKTELGGAAFSGQSGAVGLDRLNTRTGVGFVGGSGRLGERLAIGAYVIQPRAGRIDLVSVPLPDGSAEAGYLEATVTDVGAAGAYRLTDRLNVGLRLTGTHLKLEGLFRRTDRDQTVSLESGTAAGHTRLTASLGVLYETRNEKRFRAGLVVTPGASYTAERTATSAGVVLDSGSEYELRQPGLLSVGTSMQLSPEILVSGQLDYVRYSEIQVFVRPGAAQENAYGAESTVEPRLGIEVSRHFGGVSVQLRGGIHSQGAGAIAYSGANPVEGAAFSGASRRLLGAAGASLVTAAGLNIDFAATFGGDRTELLAGARIRF